MIDTATDFRTDEVEETFDGNTATGETSVDIQLASALWQSVLANASASTNASADAPSLSSYNATNRQVTVGGLSENTSRTITVTYQTAGLSDFPGADDAATKIPTIFLVMVLLLVFCLMIAYPIILIVKAIKNR